QTIIQAGAALGNFANNNNAIDVVTLFMLQSKNPITYISTTGSSENLRANLRSALGDSAYDDTFTTISSSIRFFDQFADPRKTSYSWPRSMGEAQDAFAQGKLSMYLGYGSEIPDIQKRNPHLDFGVAETPQLSNQELKTYGKLYGLVLSGQSEPLMQSAGLLFINFLTGQEPQTVIAKTFWVAPTLRALLATPPEDAALATIYASAVKNQFWYDPQTEESGKILRTMTEDAAFEQKSMESVVNEAHLKFQRLLQTISLP
ncbi:MAG: extracellular solute-binding protein, partial [Candidatus Niyogibacteria bacterium]|nr:extracellular solute-binding protein [Candidatus Niyogibacteria bacterium]